MRLPTKMSWGPRPPEGKLHDLRFALEKAYRGEGLPPALISGLVNRTMELIEGWDWEAYEWHVHYEDDA